ncbi:MULTISPECIES: flagellar basal body rod protein FlgB [Kordiimonas]|uniref:Flagellar basal body rod protein FlgB n=1 Tax=Kordiimonas lacus TaxID=637679 RepID=A0A1G7CMJ6_9PROT|nr:MULTISPECIES: flagellar basal body rod protein FlgB [Kordiimonas]SDE40569.1 flagellar basal-body rod protein FlgB [Kordiimonas lacus]
MDLTNIPLMAALKSRMKWLNTNQTVISENIGHADTPGYKAKELDKQNFSGLVDNLVSDRPQGTQMRTKNSRHMDTSGSSSVTMRTREVKDSEETPSGNSVVLEEEMMKLADNQMKYGMVVNLYKKNIGLLNIALGKGGGR